MNHGDEQPNQTAQATPADRLDDPPAPTEAQGDLADMLVSMDAEAVLTALGQAARRGKLPEYATGGSENALFRASALGQPFDRDLLAWAEPQTDGLRLRFGLRWRMKAPIIFMAAMIFTVEPGRYFLELMIPGSWGWGSIMWWYYPLTVIPIPFAWRRFMRQSRQTTLETARESHASIGKILNARPLGK